MPVETRIVRADATLRVEADRRLKGKFPFKTYRPYQKETIAEILRAFDGGIRHVFLEAPTGFGKSPVSIALAGHFGSAYILASTKYLQRQYLADFKVKTVKGRGNFPCLLSAVRTAETGDCVLSGTECRHCPRGGCGSGFREVAESARRGPLFIEDGVDVCPYWEQKCEAMRESCVVFNYDYFLNETSYVGDFGRRDLLVADEAHNIEGKLMSFVGLKITGRDLHHVQEQLPAQSMPADEWRKVLEEWRAKFAKKVQEYGTRLKTLSAMEIDRMEEMAKKTKRMDFLLEELEEDPELWVQDLHIGEGRQSGWVTFKPVEVRKWSSAIFSRAQFFLLQSATILDTATISSSLGLDGRLLFLKVPSIFKAERRPFIVAPVGSMSKANVATTMPALLDRVKGIMDENPKEKGVIHTHSYRIQSEIIGKIKDPRLVSNDSSEATDAAFRRFMASPEPRVLVTPSAYEGVDLKGDLCRWQVMCKVPYPDLGDPQIRKRMERDPRWYQWLTAVRLIQTYGRGMRSEDDHCRTYMLDSDFISFYRRNESMLPEWFREAVTQTDGA